MKITKSSKRVTAESELSRHNTYLYKGVQNRFSINDNGSTDPEKYKAQIRQIHPYDDAEYTWAKIDTDKGEIKLYRDGKCVKWFVGWLYDEYQYESVEEYFDTIIDFVCDKIIEEDKNVEPRIINNNNKVSGKKVNAHTSKPTIPYDDREYILDDLWEIMYDIPNIQTIDFTSDDTDGTEVLVTLGYVVDFDTTAQYITDAVERSKYSLVGDVNGNGNQFWFHIEKPANASCGGKGKDDINASDDEELEHPDQEYDSAATSINSNKLPAIYKMVDFKPGEVVVDYGGGKFDNGVYFVKDKGATLLVYDPYNRSDEHNQEVISTLKANGGADKALCSNVLNVIKEPEVRLSVLRNIAKLVKAGGEVFITVYEGSGTGEEGPTKSGYQLNKKTAGYLEEVQSVFPDAVRKGKLIKATNSGVTASTNAIAEGLEDIGCAIRVFECPSCGNHTLYCVDKDIMRVADVDYHDTFVCEECGDEFISEPQYDGSIKFVHEANSSTEVRGSTKLKRIARLGEFDNGYVLHNWEEMSDEEAENLARQMSIDHPGDVYYVAYDNLMDSSSRYSYKYGCRVDELNRSKLLRMTEEEIHAIECAGNRVANVPEWQVRELIKNIQDDVYNAAAELLQTEKYGYPLDEIADMLFCDVESNNSGSIRVELRAELTYDGMFELCQVCNTVIAKYDEQAYFDMVEPGISEAFVDVQTASRNIYSRKR